MRIFGTLSSEYSKSKKEYHEAKQAHESNPKDVRLQRRMWALRSKARWAYKAYNPFADMTGPPYYSVSSKKMIEVK